MSALGVDIGFGYTKVTRGQGVVVFPSQAGPAVRRHESGLNVRSLDYHLLRPVDYFVGQLAVQQMVGDTDRAADWVGTEAYTALLWTALAAVTQTFSTGYTVVTGLPINHLHRADELRGILAQRHQVQLNGGDVVKTIDVSAVRVIAQGIGALLSTVISDGGTVTDAEQVKRGRGAILDIGSKTTGLVSVEGIHEVAAETASVAVGTWDVESAVRRHLAESFPGWGEKVSAHELMTCILERRAYDRNEAIDLTGIVGDALDLAARRVLGQASALWNDGRHLRRIIVCGGGGPLFFGHIKARYPHAELIGGDPRFANVVGYFRLAQFLSRHGG
jgi:plasmid segregation protein ParM